MDWLDQCRSLCKQAKFIGEPVNWTEKPTHSGWLCAVCAILDSERSTIPGLVLQCEYRISKKTGSEEMAFGLLYRSGSERYRVFFLEIYPTWKRSHKDRKLELFGPHIHLGDERLAQITRGVYSNILAALDPKWIERFRRHAKVYDEAANKIIGPFEGDMFGGSP